MHEAEVGSHDTRGVDSASRRHVDMILVAGMYSPPWNARDVFPAPPPGEAYGWWERGRPHPSDREGLEQKCRTSDMELLVWTPEASETVADVEAGYLWDAVVERWRRRARTRLKWALVSLVAWSLFCAGLVGPRLTAAEVVLWLALGVAPLVRGLVQWHRLRKLPASADSEDKESARHAHWLADRRAPWTYAACAAAVAVFVAGWGAGTLQAVAVAGLDKEQFWSGEWWRAATGPWLHLHFLHLIFNVGALHVFGRRVEALFGWRWLCVCLAVAMITGSMASALALGADSVGFSGAILGLLGFELATTLRRREWMPPGMIEMCVGTLAVVTLLGAVGFAIIDNAAHAGGLAGGLLVGLAGARAARPESGAVLVIAVPAAVLLAAGAGGTLLLLVIGAWR